MDLQINRPKSELNVLFNSHYVKDPNFRFHFYKIIIKINYTFVINKFYIDVIDFYLYYIFTSLHILLTFVNIVVLVYNI